MAKRNPSDLTLRNLRAMKKQIAELQRRIRKVEAAVGRIQFRAKAR